MQVKRALEKVLASKILEERHGIKLKLMSQIRCDFNIKQKEMLKNSVVKHKQILNNMIDFRIIEINNITSPIKKLECKTLCELIIDTKTALGERVFLAIEKL